MREQLAARVTELETEYRAGQEMLTDLDAKRADLQQTLLRISGAIQVLKELLDTSQGNGSAPAAPPQNEDAAVPVAST
jgi:predicted nuclease with TOPRIM domain